MSDSSMESAMSPAGRELQREFDPSEIEGVLGRIRSLPIAAHLALHFDLTRSGCSEVTLKRVEPFHLGGMEQDVLNGGAILCLVDAAAASAALLHAKGLRLGTVNLSVQIHRPIRPTGVRAHGRIVREQGRCVEAVVEIEDERGAVCARGVSELRILRAKTKA